MKDRVLLVEDEEHLAYALELNLVEEGYDVDVAESVSAATDLMTRHSHDLFILDVMLPDGNGFDLCREIRNNGNRAPVLMLTAKGSSEDIVEGLEAGADDYLTKPYSLAVLLGRVAAMLRRRRWSRETPRSSAPSLEFGKNKVDFATYAATASEVSVELTDLEIRLLRFFADNAERVVSRQELLENVWEVSAQTNTRTVDNFIVRLRKIFEQNASRPRHFVTVRGVGYRFVVDPE